jgi:hypothetical protein
MPKKSFGPYKESDTDATHKLLFAVTGAEVIAVLGVALGLPIVAFRLGRRRILRRKALS